MARYRAIETFADNGIIYQVGDDYPKEGKADKTRLNDLLSENNGFKRPVIEETASTSNEETTDGYSY